MKSAIRAILVPQGAEYQAVCRGLRRAGVSDVEVMPLSIGARSAASKIKQLQLTADQYPNLLLVGLCGSLKPNYQIGDVVVCDSCIDPLPESISVQFQACDRALSKAVARKVGSQVAQVQCLTSDRIIWSASEKQELGKKYNTDVVDMEGHGVLQALNTEGIALAILRVVSDDCYQDLPDLNSAIDAEGRLQTIPLAFGMLRQPQGALRLIQGSLKGLKVLQETITTIFSS